MITAIVVTSNEGRYLEGCLRSLRFCPQVLVFDLRSTDDSVAIARRMGATVFSHAPVPYVEQLWATASGLAENSWILRADPDEVLQPALAADIQRVLSAEANLAAINLPHQYYFRNKPLHTTAWGGTQYIAKLFHRDRVELRPWVHRGLSCRSPYRQVTIRRRRNNVVVHYWCDGYGQFFRKHIRYLRAEGRSRRLAGERAGIRPLVIEPTRTLRADLVLHRGYAGGVDGLLLSGLHALYVLGSVLSQMIFERRIERHQQRGARFAER